MKIAFNSNLSNEPAFKCNSCNEVKRILTDRGVTAKIIDKYLATLAPEASTGKVTEIRHNILAKEILGYITNLPRQGAEIAKNLMRRDSFYNK